MTGSVLKPAKENQVTLLQYILIIHSMQLGIGVISLPRDLADTGGTDGWIALFIGYAGSLVASLLIVQIMKKHPEGTIIDLISRFFGRWSGYLMTAVFGVYFSLYAYLLLDRMILLIHSWIMQQSRPFVLMLLFVIPAYMIVKGGWRALGRYAEIILLCSLWMPFMLLTLFDQAHWLHLLPVLKEGWMPVFSTVPATVLSFLGFEAAFFLYPHLGNKKKASLGIFVANTLTLIVYLYVTILCFVVFSPDEITYYNDIMLTLAKIIEYRFVERFDIVMLTFYLLVISKTWIPALHMTVYCSHRLVPIGKAATHLLLLLIGMLAVTYIWNPGWLTSDKWIALFSKFGLLMAFIFPVALWCLLSVMSWFPRWQK
ncbi:GerAB/ArcD/ProY family transporter [Paenibacillus montanisoli]|uniref:Spore gernimation protein n=1 Tax=Paenibacillus montanisoli TaxID=2081970 RepID=A0A328U781_9BACL|nr:endospore germination permease [Paenibacillus montanisoli]RAP78380.1 spore gernimation protein [Paenibacillus montanisoli]